MDVFVDSDGYIVDANDNYLVDSDGLPLTEQEYDSIVEQTADSFVDSIRPGYHRLQSKLGREPTDAELERLLADAEATGDPNIDEAYERVTARPLGPNLSDDDTRLRVFAEYAEEASSEADDSAEAPEVG